MPYSTPEIVEAPELPASTLFGAPCDVTPPFSERELRHKYWGCQNLPTALWMKQLATLQENNDSKSSRNSRESPMFLAT